MPFLIHILKSVWLIFWASLATLVLFVPILLAALFSSTGNLAFTLSQIWARIMLLVSGVRTRISGRDRIRPGERYVIIANHQSLFDIPAIVTTLGIQFRWVIKRELLYAPLFGYALYQSRNIFIDRSNRERAVQSINQGFRRLPPGVGVLFFAEGSRSPDGTIRPFKKGGFSLALDHGVPILPVTVCGSRHILPKKSLAFRPGTVRITVGDPIPTQGLDKGQLDRLMNETRQVIMAHYLAGESDQVTTGTRHGS